MENKVYAVVKYPEKEWWAVIDCGKVKKGGFTTGDFWSSYFERDGKTYRWFRKLILVPDTIKEWDEIKVKEELICRITDNEANALMFEGWVDTDDGALQTLQKFAKILGKELTLDEIFKLINNNECTGSKN
jgi:hypothetical protein